MCTYIPRTYVQCFYVSDTGQKISTTTKYPHTLFHPHFHSHHFLYIYNFPYHLLYTFTLDEQQKYHQTTRKSILSSCFFISMYGRSFSTIFLMIIFFIFIRGFHTFKKRTNTQFFFSLLL